MHSDRARSADSKHTSVKSVCGSLARAVWNFHALKKFGSIYGPKTVEGINSDVRMTYPTTYQSTVQKS